MTIKRTKPSTKILNRKVPITVTILFITKGRELCGVNQSLNRKMIF